MAFNDVEISEFFQPLELYEFKRGVFSWYYTSGDEDIDFSGNIYLSVPLKRSAILSTQDLGKTSLKITLSRNVTFLDQFIATSPTDIITITITRIHASDSDPAITFKGKVINVKLIENEGEVTCSPIQSTLRRPGLRRFYQTACPHVLYGVQCAVIRTLHDVNGVLTDVSGLTITSSSFIVSINPTFDSTHFVGGYVEFVVSGLVNRRFITDHNNATGVLTLNLSFTGIIVGDTVTAFPGCDHTVATCDGKFDAIDNYGGFPFIPQKNPMDGTSVF